MFKKFKLGYNVECKNQTPVTEGQSVTSLNRVDQEQNKAKMHGLTMNWILSTSNYGRERIIEKLTWKVFLENNISKESGEEDRDDILLSLVTWFC